MEEWRSGAVDISPGQGLYPCAAPENAVAAAIPKIRKVIVVFFRIASLHNQSENESESESESESVRRLDLKLLP